MASVSPRLLLVANAKESADVLAALAEIGMERTEIGGGGDETLELFESLEPDVVVMVAGLLEGDLSSLAGAMRSGNYGRPAPIVLITDGGGEGRHAEEFKSIDFAHHIARPIQSQELLDAVIASSRHATGARLEAAMALAIEDFVSDAMGSLSFSPEPVASAPKSDELVSREDASDLVVSSEDASSEDVDFDESGDVDLSDVESSDDASSDDASSDDASSDDASSDVDLSELESRDDEPSEKPAEQQAESQQQANGKEMVVAHDTGARTVAVAKAESEALPPLPTSNWREPTQVLGDDVQDSQSGLDQESQDLLDELLPDETESGEDDDPRPIAEATTADALEDLPGAGKPRGGDFARQLRDKMSAMAERLFPGQSSVDNTMAAPSSEHTEIDLGSIVDEEEAEAATQAILSESEITMARSDTDAKTGQHVTSGSPGHAGQPLVGQVDNHGNDIAAVLSRFWTSDFSGTLVLRRQDEEKRVQFEKGSVVFASSGRAEDRMSALLLREGRINATQLEECRFQVEATGRRMGEVLVDKGYLKPRELLPAVRQHLEDIFYSLFAWQEGSYDALPGQSLDERIRLSRHPAALIVEGIRRKYDSARIEGCLGAPDTVVMVDDSQRLNNIVGATELSVAELQVQRLFDGSHSLESIAADCGVDVLRVGQLAHAFVSLGVAEIVETRNEEGDRGNISGSHFVGEIDLEIDRQRVLAKYQLVQCADYFQLLGVRLDATAFEIRRAYESSQRNFAMETFPQPLQEELGEIIDEIAILIEEAFLVLSNDSFRVSYRANLQ